MKNILTLLCIAALIIITSPLSFAQFDSTNTIATQEQDSLMSASDGEGISIGSVKVENPEYDLGNTVRGEIQILNESGLRQSDLTVTTSIEMRVDANMLTFDTQTHDSKLYAEANSPRTIVFEHNLSKDVAGDVNILARIFSSDGTLLSEKSVAITVFGIPERNLIVLPSANLSYEGENFGLQVGPTIKRDEALVLNIETGLIGTLTVVTPVFSIYNRSYQSEPIEVIRLEQITLEDESEYQFDIPTNLDPLVYAGSLSFESSEINIPSVYFRYIIEGSIGTILNANTSVLTGNKGDIVDIKISYAGTPPVINDSVELPDTQATIFVQAYNEKNKLVGEGQTIVSLGELGDAIIPITLSENSKSFRLEVVMKEGETILSEYKTELPSEQEVEDTYKIGSTTNLSMLYILIGLLILISVILIFKKKGIKGIPTVILIGAIALGGYGSYIYKTTASTLYAPTAFQGSNFRGNVIVRDSYAPGETFKPSYWGNFPSCSNAAFNHQIYGPSDNWSSFNVNLSEVNALFTGYLARWGDYALDTKLPILINWWKSKGGELVYETDSQSGASYSIDIGNQESYAFYNIRSNKEYVTPTTPGIHKFYALFVNFAGADMAAPRIVSADVCVRGAGLCTGENAICPNLVGNYTQSADGVISKDGVVTNYIKNSSGNCVTPPSQNCDNSHTGGLSCDNGQVMDWYCRDGEWKANLRSITCPDGIWCSNSRTVVSDATTYFSLYPLNNNNNLKWTFPDGTTLSGKGRWSAVYSHEPLGNFTTYVESTSPEGVTRRTSCPFEVVCGAKPLDGKETACTNGFKQEYVCTQESGYELQTVACPPEEITVSCSAPQSAIVGSEVTYTATPLNATNYSWYRGATGNLLSGGISNQYKTRYTTVGTKRVTVDVTKNNQTKTAQCTTTYVDCNGNHDEGEVEVSCNENRREQYWTCTEGSTGWNTAWRDCGGDNGNDGDSDPIVTTFEFDPGIINPNANPPNNMCGITLNASNVTSCTLTRTTGNAPQIQIPLTSAGTISVQRDRRVPTGRYELTCSSATVLNKSFGVKTCLANANVRED